MKKCLFLFTLILLILVFLRFSQKSEAAVVFHQIEFSATSVELIKLDVADTSNIPFIKETIDNYGRTVELRFYNSRHQLTYPGSGFYGGPIIAYNYQDNQILETFYSDENQIANDFRTSEVPYRFIYNLDDSKNIKSIEKKYIMEFEWSNESIKEAINHLEFYRKFDFEGSELKSVFGYSYALGKMNGIAPIKN